MKRCGPLTLAVSVLLTLSFLAADRALAVAAFSRQYKTECSTCHCPYPRRNEFGEAFRKNGYVWPGTKVIEKPEGKEAFWLSGITESLPLSVTLRHDLAYDPDQGEDRVAPATDVFLHAGGTLRDKVGFFAHDLTGDGEAFALFPRAFGTPFSVKYGKFTPQTTLWKENQAVTATPLAPLAFSVSGGGPPLATPRNALEVNAVVGSRLFAAAAVVDRGKQNDMEFAGHVSYKIGGVDFLGKEPDVDFDAESIWDYLAVTIGGFAYQGKIANKGTEGATYDTRSNRFGLEAEALYRRFTFLISGVFGRDDDIDGTGTRVDSAVLAAEMDCFFAPNYLVALRYEHEDVGNATEGIAQRVIGCLTWVPIENLFLSLETKYVRNEDPKDSVDVTGLFRIEYSL